MAHSITHHRSGGITRFGIYAVTTTVLLGVANLAHAQATATPSKPQPGMGSPSSVAMNKTMSSMMKSMENVPMSGDTDRDFAATMRIHHQGAVDMAQAEIDGGKDPQLKAMAKKIISAQKKEIAEFDQWLAKHKATAWSNTPVQK
jgi:uncharacterized protein (DUF305 family)